jgi:hypothetical protein
MALESMRNQFSGLPMQDLIGSPLKAACDAQVLLARSTYEFIRDVGFDGDKTRHADFSFNRYVVTGKDAMGNDIMDQQKVALEVPVLAIVNVPSLMVDQVDITFDMEVRSSESSTETEDKSFAGKASASIGWGCFKASVEMSGSVASHKENSRKSDNSAKYHVEVHAADAGTPEGLSRVLDIIASNVAPKQVESQERKRVAASPDVQTAATDFDTKTRALNDAEMELSVAKSDLQNKLNTQTSTGQLSSSTQQDKDAAQAAVDTAKDRVEKANIAANAARTDVSEARKVLEQKKASA